MKFLNKYIRITAAVMLITTFTVPALARTAYVDRLDTGIIEEVTIAIQGAYQRFIKETLTNLSNIKAISELRNLESQIKQILDLRDEALSMANTGLSNVLNETVGKAQDSFNGTLEKLGSTVSSSSGGILDKLFGNNVTNADSYGLSGCVITGQNGDVSYADSLGGNNSLSSIAMKNGIGAAADAAVSRVNAGLDKATSTATLNGDEEQAIMSGYAYLIKAVPILNKDVIDAYLDAAETIGSNNGDKETFLAFVADSSKSAPLAAITQELDKYLAKESPYEKTEYEKKLKEEISKDAEELKTISENDDSPECKLTGLMGTTVRQNELTMRQYADIIDIAADTVRINSIESGMKAEDMSRALAEKIEKYNEQLVLADPTTRTNMYKKSGVLSTGGVKQ